LDPQPIVKFINQEHGSDCGVASLAMALGISYPESLIAVAKVKPNILVAGATWKELRAAARKLGMPLKVAKFDPEDEDASGILAVGFIEDGKYYEHAVYLKQGLVFDGSTGAIWDLDVYLQAHSADVRSMLIRA
jgi:ABC-type bacteriocin/lantibiotic exporter with double-glycine peptidase domain